MKNKTLRVVYGFNPCGRRRQYSDTHRAYVYVIGVTGEWKLLGTSDCDEVDVNNKTWKNGTITNARNHAEKSAKFYGVKPERMEGLKVVPRSFKYTEAACTNLGINRVN